MLGFFSLSGSLFATKGYTISPSNTLTVTAPANNLSVYDIYQNNITSSTIYIKWKKLSIDMPSGWDYSLCDLGTCYGAIPDSSQMADVVQGDKGFLGFNVDPKNLGGTAVAKFYVYEAGHYNEGDTITFIITAEATSIEQSLVDLSMINLYPNPSNGIITVQTAFNAGSKLEITDVSGKVLMLVPVGLAPLDIDLSAFEKGIYYARFTAGESIIAQKFIKL